MHGGVLLRKMTEEARGTTLAVPPDSRESVNDLCKIVGCTALLHTATHISFFFLRLRLLSIDDWTVQNKTGVFSLPWKSNRESHTSIEKRTKDELC